MSYRGIIRDTLLAGLLVSSGWIDTREDGSLSVGYSEAKDRAAQQMAETGVALMLKVEELSEIIKAQSLKLTTRQRGYYMDAQSAQTGGGCLLYTSPSPRD